MAHGNKLDITDTISPSQIYSQVLHGYSPFYRTSDASHVLHTMIQLAAACIYWLACGFMSLDEWRWYLPRDFGEYPGVHTQNEIILSTTAPVCSRSHIPAHIPAYGHAHIKRNTLPRETHAIWLEPNLTCTS